MAATENVRFLFNGIIVDDRTRDYIEKRLSTLDKLNDKILQTEVEIQLDKKGKFRVEVMLHTPRNKFRAENITESIEASTDLVVDELRDQLAHMKDKLMTLKKRGARSIKKKVVIDKSARF
jgi:ribosomal subunit interface protein